MLLNDQLNTRMFSNIWKHKSQWLREYYAPALVKQLALYIIITIHNILFSGIYNVVKFKVRMV